MADIKLIKKNDIIDFDMIAPGIFGDQYKAMTVLSVAPYSIAQAFDQNLATKHAAFYPLFKDSVDNIDSPSIYDYFILQKDITKAEYIAIGFPWINEASLKGIVTRRANVVIQNFQEFHRAPLLDFMNSLNVEYTFLVTDS
jgi:hypothetical protein